MSYDYYLEKKYPTPEIFSGLYRNSSALIIGTGPSTSKLLKHKHKVKDIFDVVIGVNFSILDFDDYLDFYLCAENKPQLLINEFKKNKYKKDIPRLVSYISIDRWPKNFNLFKIHRDTFARKPDIRKYKTENGEGLFKGYDTLSKSPAGAVLQSLHFSTILGCNKIYIIGSEFHYEIGARYYHAEYERKHNLNPRSKRNEHKLIEVKVGQKTYRTLNAYKWAAHYTNRLIDEECIPNGVEVIDFSDGLLTSATQLDLDKFMENK
jgi:hypothetical protein